MNTQAQAVLDFWFADATGARREWFQKDAAFDREIEQRFGARIEQALAGDLRAWDADGPQGALARILVLDQFTRNVHRDTPRAFAGDPLALRAALDLIAAGQDQALPPFRRAFVYMPLEHAEELAMQDQAVALFTRLAGENAALADMLEYARRHRDVIRRFGRFPHRNAILQRPSTPEEVAFLKQPGSKF